MPAPAQYTATRLRTTLPAQLMRGSQIGWYWVNSLLPLTTWLPPTKAIRDQLKVWPLMVDHCAGIDLYGASILLPALRPLASIWLAISVLSTLANTIAPSMLSVPAPCCSRL